MNSSQQAECYREEFKKPLEDINEDIFFRADNFQNEAWYDEFLLFTAIGVCQPNPEHVSEIQKALKIMGYHTRTSELAGKIYVLPGESRNRE